MQISIPHTPFCLGNPHYSGLLRQNRGVTYRPRNRSKTFIDSTWDHTQSQRRQKNRAVACAAQPIVFRDILEKLMDGKDLSEDEARQSLYELVQNGAENPAQMAAFVVLLRAKGETPEEIAGMAKAMDDLCLRVETPYDVLDIVGTGGDGIGSVNISTGATVVAAAAGAKVAKHGSRSVSSLCGSGDVVEELGVALELGPEGIAKCIEEAGLGFMFAPTFHPAMKVVRPVRSALGVRTAFNMLGPLLNPARAKYALIGVYSTDISDLMANAAQLMGIEKALVVHSMGLDELTPMGPATVVEASSGTLRRYEIDPKDFGIPRCEVKDLAGGDAALNAQILRDVFGGSRNAVADALNLNAGVALAAARVASDVKEGIAMAQEVQRQGRPADTLQAGLHPVMQPSNKGCNNDTRGTHGGIQSNTRSCGLSPTVLIFIIVVFIEYI